MRLLAVAALACVAACERARVPPLPAARAAHGVAGAGGRIVLAGGAGAGGLTARVDLLDATRGTWRRGADLPTPRAFPGVVALGGAVYVVGGMRGREEPLAAVERYDPARDRWEARAPLLRARSRFACAATERAIVVAGGYVGDGDTESVEVYDSEKDAWRAGPALPFAVHSLAAAVLDGKVHVFGGLGNQATHLRLDGDRWTALRPMGRERIFLAAAAVGGRILAAGGRLRDAPLEAYDPAKEAWVPLRPMPRPVNRFGAVALDGRLVTFGGEAPDGSTLDAVLAYDPSADAWG